MTVSFLVITAFKFTTSVDIVIDGFQFRINDDSMDELKEIHIKGTFTKQFFHDDIFDGIISIEGYEFTENGSTVSLDFIQGNVAYMGYVGKMDMTYFGGIVADGKFERFTICVFEPIGKSDKKNWSSDSGIVICAEAADRKDAERIYNSLAPNPFFR